MHFGKHYRLCGASKQRGLQAAYTRRIASDERANIAGRREKASHSNLRTRSISALPQKITGSV